MTPRFFVVAKNACFPCAALLFAVLSPAAFAQGNLELPDPGGPSFANSIGGEAARTVTPDVVYSNQGPIYDTAGGAYAASGVAYSPLLGAHLRARYNTQSYGQTRGNLNLGAMSLIEQGDGSAWFVDGQVVMNDDDQIGYNAGVGYRFMTLPLLPFTADDEKIAGVSLWSDGVSSRNDNFISQIGLSLEYLGDNWDLRANTYLPFSDREIGQFTFTGDFFYSGNFLNRETIAGVDEALTVNEIEVARRLGNLEAWGFLGGYSLNGESIDTGGYRAGVRGYAAPDVGLQLAVTDDDEFGTNVVFSATWFIGRTRAGTRAATSSDLYTRMREPVIRNDFIAIRQTTVTSGSPITADLKGDGFDSALRVVHVDSTAPAGGDGTFEAPLNSLNDVQANSGEDAVVLVHSGSAFADNNAVLQDGQRLLGEGAGVAHSVFSNRIGTVFLPETAPGALAGPIPTITNTAGDAVTVANHTLEVSNLSIDGGDRGVVSAAGATEVDLNNLMIANTTGNGIELTAGAKQTDPNDASTLASSFSPTISTVTFENVGGDDIDLDAAPNGAAGTEQITISDITSTGGAGVGIDLRNNTMAASITNFVHDGGGASTGGLRLTDSEANVTVTGADVTNQGGFGVSIVGGTAAATHTLTDFDITDTGGAAFAISGGANNVNYDGTITQGQAADTIAVDGLHTGNVTFISTAGGAVVTATNGDGLRFSNADGSYLFLSAVNLDGTANAADTAIVLTTDTDGTFDFMDATITSPTGDALVIDGGEADVMFTGSITQANNASAVSVSNHDAAGSLTVNAPAAGGDAITATGGDGLQFNGADGDYVFNGPVTLNGGDAGIDIENASEGGFTFADTTITSPTGEGFRIDGGSANVAFTGSITQANNAAAVLVENGHTGTVMFNQAATDTSLINATNGSGLQFNNADGAYTFNEIDNATATTVALNGGDAGIDIVGGSDGTFTFEGAQITDPSGAGLNIDGGAAAQTVTYIGGISQSNNAAAISVGGGHQGELILLPLLGGGGDIFADAGPGLIFTNADGTYTVGNNLVLSGSAGIDIGAGSSGAFDFLATTSVITNPTAQAVRVDGGDATVTYAGAITGNTGRAATITNNTGGAVTLNGSVANTASGILIDGNTGGAFSFNGGVTLSTGANDAITLNNNAGTTIAFASPVSLTTTSGDGIMATDTVGLSVIGAGNTITVDDGVGLNFNTVDVDAAGVTFDPVTVNGAGSEVQLINVTGGDVTVNGVVQ